MGRGGGGEGRGVLGIAWRGELVWRRVLWGGGNLEEGSGGVVMCCRVIGDGGWDGGLGGDGVGE